MKTPGEASHYATGEEITQAIAELRAHIAALAADAKRARKAARDADPLFDFKPRTRNGRAAARMIETVRSPEVLEVTDRAIWASGQHEFAIQAADVLASPAPRLDHWAVANGLDLAQRVDLAAKVRQLDARIARIKEARDGH
jgi:hypothetical protein